MSELFFIILTAFAVIGLFYCLEFASFFMLRKYFPKSITLMMYSEDDMTYIKYKSLIYNIYNNKILLLNSAEKNIYSDASVINDDAVTEFLINNLFTKYDN